MSDHGLTSLNPPPPRGSDGRIHDADEPPPGRPPMTAPPGRRSAGEPPLCCPHNVQYDTRCWACNPAVPLEDDASFLTRLERVWPELEKRLMERQGMNWPRRG